MSLKIWTNRGHGDDHSKYRTVIKLWREYRFHIFWRGDTDLHCHDHPNDFWTFPFRGYWEEVEFPGIDLKVKEYVKPFRWHFRRAEYRHRILGSRHWTDLDMDDFYAGGFITLIQQTQDRRKWGFWVDGVFVYWRKYLGQES